MTTRRNIVISLQSTHQLLPGGIAVVSASPERDTHLYGFALSKEIAESFNLRSAKIGGVDIVLDAIPMTLFYTEEKSELEKLAERLEENLDAVAADLDEDVAILSELLALVPRRIEPPPFRYFVPANGRIEFEVENASSEPKVFRCTFAGQESP